MPFEVSHRSLAVLVRVAAASGALAVAACAPDAVRESAPARSATPSGISDSAASARAGAAEPGRGARPDSLIPGSAPTTPAPATPDSARSTPAPPAPRSDTTTSTRASSPGVDHLLPERTRHDTVSFIATVRAGQRSTGWPVSGPAPRPGAILPARRVVAYYGNPLSKKMGVLGEYPSDEMLARLDQEVERWRAADPSTPVTPALHLIAVVAQGSAGKDGMFRARMPATLIEQVYGWAQSRHALLFLDIQVAKSTLEAELPKLLPYLERPDIHLGIDPEFSMHYEREGLPPGKKIGTMHASDVNYAVRTLAELVEKHHLPPKILVVHRFTQRMVPDAENIRLDPRVQVVMDMDGWGPAWLKFDSYRDYIVAAPVQFTGFKIFYHNDGRLGPLLTPAELLQLVPRPYYIQYQ